VSEVAEQGDFEYVFKILQQQLLHASVHFYIWQKLWPTEEVVEVINRHKGFFLPTRDAHLDRIVLKVTDILSTQPKRPPSFYRILNMISRNPSLAPDINVREIKKRLRNHKRVLEALKDFRNMRVAHWDTTIEALDKPMLFGETTEMLTELKDISNQISASHSRTTLSFRFSQQGNTDHLLSILKDKLKQDKETLEGLGKRGLLRKD